MCAIESMCLTLKPTSNRIVSSLSVHVCMFTYNTMSASENNGQSLPLKSIHTHTECQRRTNSTRSDEQSDTHEKQWASFEKFRYLTSLIIDKTCPNMNRRTTTTNDELDCLSSSDDTQKRKSLTLLLLLFSTVCEFLVGCRLLLFRKWDDAQNRLRSNY